MSEFRLDKALTSTLCAHTGGQVREVGGPNLLTRGRHLPRTHDGYGSRSLFCLVIRGYDYFNPLFFILSYALKTKSSKLGAYWEIADLVCYHS